MFSCNLPPALLAEWPWSFMCYRGNTRVEEINNSKESWPWRIITMEVCKVPTLQLKALNKHDTHNIHQDGKCYQQFHKKLKHNVDINKGSSITTWKMYTHTHTHSHSHTHTRRRRRFSCLSCRDSNPQPFSHRSGALTTELTLFPYLGSILHLNACQDISLRFCSTATYVLILYFQEW